ncbi:phosphonate ABC transporter ATP-binding protein [Anaerobacillus alkalidiazotrophicus]|uniref:Phosphonate ABC transporter ATP-binding protein n=1 Tax=Anaerobacillus alkalidiazotrophicus TaxID=472963 RepID=A0A1S2M0I0_9BACI|nr:phosphonate ABC transporter ATP-binding protein [Anaerobacillus alkalidiazotrophicus]OIJ18209.1 phosphonate ABC transporter ATP-binding protein [Anaerobacillus alkalidiazotrophicus]OIJ19688.1 phosphonate ABC transporter ATP-binding protein [Anaerobacillus alkalidiazotrophicus]
MLQLNNLHVKYPKVKEKALSNISLSFNRGEFICILGKSGAGKSTFIRCLNGLQRPTSGSVILNHQNIFSLKETELRRVRVEMGMIFQHFNLIPRLTVYQNVLTGMFGSRTPLKNLLGLFSKEEKQLANKMIESVDLTPHKDKRIEELSGGQKQRVAIARALLQNPKVFLGDEPVASLDPGTANRIFSLLQTMHNEYNLLTIINVHDVILAKKFATRIIALREGKVIFDDTPEYFTDETYNEVYL